MSRRFWLGHALLPAVLFGALAWLIWYYRLDFRTAGYFYSAATGQWPYRSAFWAKTLIHEGGRGLIKTIGIAALLVWPLSLRWPVLRAWRWPAALLVAALALCPALVALLKQLSNMDCPWSLQDFGGERSFYGLFQSKPADLPRGVCFPGAHSVGAFALYSAYFAMRDSARRTAYLLLILATGLGVLYAFGQWARGAHFPSHDLSSAALAWFICLGLYVGFFRSYLRS